MGKEHRQQKVESFLSGNDMRRPLHIPSSVSLGEHMCFIVLLFVLLMQGVLLGSVGYFQGFVLFSVT